MRNRGKRVFEGEEKVVKQRRKRGGRKKGGGGNLLEEHLSALIELYFLLVSI